MVDVAATIGYQIAMVYSIFSIYGYNTDDYKIKEIILSGGNIIEEVNKNSDKNVQNPEKEKQEVINGVIRETIEDVANGAVFVGQLGIKSTATKEAGKLIVNRAVSAMVRETVEVSSIRVATNTLEISSVKAAEIAMFNTVKQIAVESSKELVETGITTGTKIAIEASKEAFIEVSTEGVETAITYGTKESIKEITETIVVQQGGKAWLINLGKAVPFIGAGISAIMNTFSTAKVGARLVDYLDKEFENNQQKQVNLLKGKVKGLYNILEQLNNIN